MAYSVDPGVIGLDVDYLQEGEAVASARFKQQDPKTTLIRHAVRLQPGEYQARMTVYRSDGRASSTGACCSFPPKASPAST